MSFGFAEGLQADPVLQKIKEEFGEGYLKDLAIQTPVDAERIKNFDGQSFDKPQRSTSSLITSIREALDQLPVPLFQGSNGWAISGEHTKSGFPILANDTHIGFAQPAVWYEAHIEYPGFSFYGHHLAGIPFGLLGNNRSTAWGLTMFENDDTDFFIETPNPENANQVKFKDQWEELKTRTETIKVKDSSDVVFDVKSSRHGPIVNQVFDNGPAKSQPIALWWLLTQDVDNEILEAVYRLNRTSNIQEMQLVASMIDAPGLNVMYADVKGNIAWWAVAKLPIRPAHVESKLFLDGTGSDEYLGFYDFSKNPHAVNPPWGYVYSSNNQPDTVEGVLYPGYYYPKSRAGRINQLLQEDLKWSLEDVKKVSLDVVSNTHPEVAKEIAGVLKSLNKDEYSTFVDVLESWNGDHRSTDTAPSVYYNLLSQIMFLGMNDELGITAYKSLMETSVPKNSYLTFIRNDASPWWDNVRTTNTKETRSDIIKEAADNALRILTQTCGPKLEDWVWEKIHTLTHSHALGSVKPLDRFFNVGPFAVSGGSEVINNLALSLDTTGYFPVVSGPALRKITDFGDLSHGETVSPTGQSGNVMSDYYDDQAEMFATGKFRLMMMDKKEIEERSKNKLTLKAP
jgi:penicillin amidase